MDSYEATKIVFQRIQALDSQNASKIMGALLIQEHGEKEMIRLAFGPESLVHSVILRARKDLNLPSLPNTPSTTTSNLSSSASASWPLAPAVSSFTDDSQQVDLIDELQLQDQLSFLNDGVLPKSSYLYDQNDAVLFNSNHVHRRSCSVNDILVGPADHHHYSHDMMNNGGGLGFGWKPCLFYARGFCKNGTTCRFIHGGEATAVDGGAPVVVGSPENCHNHEQLLLRSKSTHQQSNNNGFVYSPSSANKCMSFLQLPSDNNSPRALMMGRARVERGDFGGMSYGLNSPGSRQIYLTFPADSTFKEEDVSNYFSNFGPVQDVRIPYQQKRMFGFVTFDYPETVKLILAKGNPHFVCDARVLVKPYKEKGKIPDKHRKQQQQMERGEFGGCGTPTGIDSRDSYDLQLGAGMFYNTEDILWRRKLEEQADLQHAIELQNRRLMSLQLLDIKRNSHHRALSTSAVVSSPTFSPRFLNQNMVIPSNRSSPEAKEENGSIGTLANPANFTADQEMRRTVNVVENGKKDFFAMNENSNGKEITPKESDFQESLEHNLPDNPFASPKATGDYVTAFSETEKGGAISPPSSTSNNLITVPSLFPATTSLDMAPFKSCYFPMPRFASGHETIGM